MTLTKTARMITVFLLAVAAVFAMQTHAYAATTEEQLQAKMDELMQEKSKIAELYAGDDTTKTKIDELTIKITENEKSVLDQTKKVEEAKAERDKILNSLSINEEEMNNRLRRMYKNGGMSFIEVMLSSDNIVDLMENLTMTSYIYEQDAQIVEELKAEDEKMEVSVKEEQDTLDKLKEEQESLITEKADLESTKAASEENIKAIEQNIVALDTEVAELQAKYKEETGKDYTAAVTTVHPIDGGGLDTAYRLLGTPYVWGGESPAGTDCSGLVVQAYGYARGRTTWEMIASLKASGDWKTSLSSLKVGDLIFPHDGHVGIYLGDGKMIHASSDQQKVVIGNVYKFLGGGTY